MEWRPVACEDLMRHIDPNQPEFPETEAVGAVEQRLREENQDLKRQVQKLKALQTSEDGPAARLWRPSAITVWSLLLGSAVLIAIAFAAGYIPRQQRESVILAEARQHEQSLPRAEVIQVGQGAHSTELELPGSIQAIAEAPILARASGYVARRLADMGDRVSAGQTLAEIEAPELTGQVRQAEANLQQAKAALEQSLANLEQGKSDMEFSRVTADRWSNLFKQGIVSRQEQDLYRTQFQSRAANVRALEKAVAAQRSGIAAAEANLARMIEMQNFRVVKAPFDGVITQRNVDTGALVNAGTTLLFRLAQTDTVRTYLNVPQLNASAVRVGQPANIRISNLPGRNFTGMVKRTANALDPASRTMLVEVHVPNADGALMPGMFAQVALSSERAKPPMLIPSDALVIRGDGTRVAVVRPDHKVHMQIVQVGRDYGDRIEIISGLQAGGTIIPNPGDLAQEGLLVEPVPRAAAAQEQ